MQTIGKVLTAGVVIAGIILWALLQLFGSPVHASGIRSCTYHAPCVRYVRDYEEPGHPMVRACFVYDAHARIHFFPVPCHR